MNGFGYEGIIGLLVICIILLAAGLYWMMRRTKKEHRTWQLKTEMLEDNYRALLELYEKKSVLVHDMKNHLLAMAKMLEEGQKEETLAYIAQMTGGIRKSGSVIHTNHKILDSILNQKFQEAREAQLDIQCAYDDMRDLKLDLAEICSLFANLLDNAIEAAGQCPDGAERRIDVACRKQGRMLVVSVSNSVAEENKLEPDALLRTTKADKEMHGFGMISVKKVISGHDGYMKADIRDHRLYIVVYLVGFVK